MTDDESSHGPLRLYIHSILSASQSSHGVSHEDYAQYASYCTRRLSRIRHGQSVKKDLVRIRQFKNSLSTRQTENDGGKTKKYAYRHIDLTNLPSEVLASSENYILEPLYCAERCWAESHAVKSDAGAGGISSFENNPRDGWSSGRIRSYSIKKLRKAVKFADLVEKLSASTVPMPRETEDEESNEVEEPAQPPCDDHTQLEAKAYASFMRGNLALEQNSYLVAYKEYSKSMKLCEQIASTAANDNEESDVQQLELLDFFTTRSQHVIAPSLRYCQYELQEKGIALPDDDGPSSVQSNGTTMPQSTESMSQITYRENVISVETKELRMSLLKMQDMKQDWEETAEENASSDNGCSSEAEDVKFMSLLNGYDDLIHLANNELKQLESLKAGPAVNAKRYQLVNLVGYCKNQKLKMVMSRNERLVNSIVESVKSDDGDVTAQLKRFEDVAHLYDALLQDAKSVSRLPGGGTPDDLASGAPVEDEFYLEANANTLRLRSMRCYYLALMHASPLVKKYAEAKNLLEQSETLAKEALEEIAACDQLENGDEYLDQLEGVLNEMKGLKCRMFAVSYLSTSGSSSNRPLLQRLHDYDVPSNPTDVVDIPPRVQGIVCKSSFFDVALNYVSEYPAEELDREMNELGHGSGDKDNSSSSGLFGWFRR